VAVRVRRAAWLAWLSTSLGFWLSCDGVESVALDLVVVAIFKTLYRTVRVFTLLLSLTRDQLLQNTLLVSNKRRRVLNALLLNIWTP
jgi:hypothetical protein